MFDLRFSILADSREKRPLPLSGRFPIIRKGLKSGDYSILGLEERVAFERKGRNDFVACIRSERRRFENQLERLSRYQYRAVLIEANYGDFDTKFWRSHATPEAIKNSIASWSLWGTPLIFCGNARGAAQHLERTFYSIASMVARENQHIRLIEGEMTCKTSHSQGA